MIVSENACKKIYGIGNLAPWWWSFYLTICLFVFYLIFPHHMLIISFYMMLLVTGTAVLWHRFPNPLQYEMEWANLRAYAGDTTYLRLAITNNSFLPWTMVKVIFRLPGGMGKKIYARQMVIGPFQQKHVELEIESLRRGVYALPALEIRRADLFGLGWIREKWQGAGEIVVFPSFLDLLFDKLPHNRPFGQVKVKQKAFEDFSSLSALRDYVDGDSLRKVEWKATARLNKLQVKEYELTATGSFYLLPDVNADVHGKDEQGEPTEEITISAAATIARQSFERNATVGLISADFWKEHLYASDRAQSLDFIMESLARLKLGNKIPVGKLLSKTVNYLSCGSTIIIITPKLLDDELLRQLYHARYRGCNVLVLWQHQAKDETGAELNTIGSLEKIGVEVVPVSFAA